MNFLKSAILFSGMPTQQLCMLIALSSVEVVSALQMMTGIRGKGKPNISELWTAMKESLPNINQDQVKIEVTEHGRSLVLVKNDETLRCSENDRYCYWKVDNPEASIDDWTVQGHYPITNVIELLKNESIRLCLGQEGQQETVTLDLTLEKERKCKWCQWCPGSDDHTCSWEWIRCETVEQGIRNISEISTTVPSNDNSISSQCGDVSSLRNPRVQKDRAQGPTYSEDGVPILRKTYWDGFTYIGEVNQGDSMPDGTGLLSVRYPTDGAMPYLRYLDKGFPTLLVFPKTTYQYEGIVKYRNKSVYTMDNVNDNTTGTKAWTQVWFDLQARYFTDGCNRVFSNGNAFHLEDKSCRGLHRGIAIRKYDNAIFQGTWNLEKDGSRYLTKGTIIVPITRGTTNKITWNYLSEKYGFDRSGPPNCYNIRDIVQKNYANIDAVQINIDMSIRKNCNFGEVPTMFDDSKLLVPCNLAARCYTKLGEGPKSRNENRALKAIVAKHEEQALKAIDIVAEHEEQRWLNTKWAHVGNMVM